MLNRPSTAVPTRWSLVTQLQPGSPGAQQALAWLCQAYWQPLRDAAMRRGFDAHAAEDCAQSFFVRVIERGLGAPDRSVGRFRAWVRAAFSKHCIDVLRAETAQRRGGDLAMLPLDGITEPVTSTSDEFDRDWAAQVTARAIARLERDQAEPARFERLRALVFGEAPADAYTSAARDLAATPGALRVAVHRLRKRLAELIRDEVRQTLVVPDDPQQAERLIDAELRALVGST